MAAVSRILGCLIVSTLLTREAPSASSPSALRSVHRKIDALEEDRLPPGARVTLTVSELTAYATEEADAVAPGAVRDIALRLAPSRAEGSAYINFLKVRQAQGHADNWMIRQLLDGEREVRVAVTLQSADGRARVDVERVEVSGIVMDGKALDYLIRQFLIPNYPDARVSSWFKLGHNIDRIVLRGGAVSILLKQH